MNTPTASATPRPSLGSSVRLAGVTKSFGSTTAVDDVDFEVKAGEFVTLLGPSGSGKTTILRMLAGFEVPTSGDIHLGGTEVGRIPPAERNIGMVFQHYALFPHMNVRDNIDYGLRMRRLPKQEREARVDEMLLLVGLEALGSRRPNQLSGGQQQRVALARALAIRPQLLLMDEPLGALDRALRVEMSGEIKRLHRETGTTFLYVTHDQEEALLLSDRVAIMRDGKIGAIDTPEALHDRPPTRFVAEFFANANVLMGATVTASSSGVAVSFGDQKLTIRLPDHGLRVTAVAFHPHRAKVTTPNTVTPNALMVDGIIDEILFMGVSHQVNVTAASGQRIIVRSAERLPVGIAPGSLTRIAIHEADLLAVADESADKDSSSA